MQEGLLPTPLFGIKRKKVNLLKGKLTLVISKEGKPKRIKDIKFFHSKVNKLDKFLEKWANKGFKIVYYFH